MRIFRKEEVTQNTLDSVLCNMCGDEMITDSSPGGNGAQVFYNGGYDSEIIGDGTNLQLDICEKCLSEIVEKCKIPPSAVVVGVGLD